MTMAGTHVIGTITLKVDVADQQIADELFSVVHDQCFEALPERIGKTLDQVMPSPNSVWRMDRVVLDLGTLQRRGLSAALLEGIQTQLQEYFSGYFREQAPEAVAPETKYGALLHYFLQRGRMPWWADAGLSGLPLIRLLADYFKKDAATARDFLREAVRHPDVLRRLVGQLPPDAYRQLVRMVHPGFSPAWFTEFDRLGVYAGKVLSETNGTPILARTREAMLYWALDGAEGGKPELVKTILDHIADLLDVPAHLLEQHLGNARPAAAKPPAVLSAYLRERGLRSSDAPAESLSTEDAWALLQHFLEHGYLLHHTWVQGPERLLEILSGQPGNRPSRTKSVTFLKKTAVRRRLVTQFSSDQLDQLLILFAGPAVPHFLEAGERLFELLRYDDPEQERRTILQRFLMDFMAHAGLSSASRWLPYVFEAVTDRMELPASDFSTYLAGQGGAPQLEGLKRFMETGDALTWMPGGAARVSEKSSAIDTSTAVQVPEKAQQGELSMDQVLYLLEYGRLPDRRSSSAVDLVPSILYRLREQPEEARRRLLAMSKRVNLAQRLTRQFPDAVAGAVLAVLYPVQWADYKNLLEELISLGTKVYGRKLSGSAVWKTALKQLLAYPETPPSLPDVLEFSIREFSEKLNRSTTDLRQAFLQQLITSGQTGESLVFRMITLEDTFSAGERQHATAPMSREMQLFYYLEWGRIPEGGDLTPDQLDAVLMAEISEAPARLRQRLLTLERMDDIARRMSSRFSPSTLRSVLEIVLADQSRDAFGLLLQLESTLADRFGLSFTEGSFWRLALRHLLPRRDAPVSFPGLIRFLLESSSEKGFDSELGDSILQSMEELDPSDLPPSETPPAFPVAEPSDTADIALQQQVLKSLLAGTWPEVGNELITFENTLSAQFPGRIRQEQYWRLATHTFLDISDMQSALRMFIQRVEHRLAAELNVDLEAIRKTLLEALPETPQGQPASLRLFLQSVPVVSDFPENTTLIELLRQPYTEQSAGAFEERLHQALKQAPAQVNLLLNHAALRKLLAARLVPAGRVDTLHQLLERLLAETWPEVRDTLVQLEKTITEQFPGQVPHEQYWQQAAVHWLEKTQDGAELAGFIHKLERLLAGKLNIPQGTIRETLLSSWSGPTAPGRPALPLPAEEPALPEEAQLLHFLEWGRLPQGSRLTPADLASILLRMASGAPERTRRHLLELNRNIHLATRLNQHFPVEVLGEIVGVVLPEQWPQLRVLIGDLSAATLRLYSTQIGSDFIWRTAIRRLLTPHAAAADLPRLVTGIVQEMADYLNLPASFLLEQQLQPELLRPGGYQTLTQQTILRITGKLHDADLERLIQRTTERMQPENTEKAPGTDPAVSALNRLLFRLGQGNGAWWDAASDSTAQLLDELSRLDGRALRTAIIRLGQPPIQDRWLADLRPETFDVYLKILWEDYALLLGSVQEGLRWIIAVRNLSFKWPVFRAQLLRFAVQGARMDSGRLIKIVLHSASAASGKTEAEWQSWLRRYAEAAAAQGDLYARRIVEVLPDLPRIHLPEQPEIRPLPYVQKEPNDYATLLDQDLEAVRMFLKYGVLPEEQGKISREALGFTIQRLTEKHPRLVLPVFRSTFSNRESVQRMLGVTTPQGWTLAGNILLTPFFEEAMEIRMDVFSRLDRVFMRLSRLEAERLFFEFLFHYAGRQGNTAFRAVDFTEGLLRWIMQELSLPESVLWAHLTTTPMAKGRLSELFPLLQSRFRTVDDAGSARHPDKKPAENRDSLRETLYIHNAGLVLLAPYLSRYFSALDLLENRMFKDEPAQERAVHLLQYLASGQASTPEHLLVFNKLLCGMPLEAPVALGITLSEEEISVSDSLLKAVLQHWDVMRNASIQNFQGSFLIRDGRLDQQEDRWMLNVESKAYDIVLEYLPWSFSIISLPWMDKRIDVAWNKRK